MHYRSGVGVIIGRLNAFEATESGAGAAAVEDVQVEYAPHSLKAIMGAKKKPLDTKAAGDVGIEADRVGFENARAHCSDFAAGISGAIQHKVGMQASENVLAINKDPNAPIFEFSDLGVVGDLHKILPKLTEAVKAKKGA